MSIETPTHTPSRPPCTDARCGCSWIEDLFQAGMDAIDDIAVHGKRAGQIPTGFPELDELIGGLMPGTMTVIGGYPGAGSSTLALDFTRYAAIRHSIPAAYLTLDTHREQLLERLLAAESKIHLRDIRAGRMSNDDWTLLARRMSEIHAAPLVLTRPIGRDIAEIDAQVRTLVDNHQIKLVVIDPLHMVTARTDLSYENREREVSEVVRRLKTLALDLDIAIVITSHLTNNPGPRQAIPARASLSDLRDSGVTAHVADLVILLDRPDLFERDDPRGGEVDLIVAKHRHGPTAVLTMAHQLHLCRFVSMGRV